jgi:hypothetical protein
LCRPRDLVGSTAAERYPLDTHGVVMIHRTVMFATTFAGSLVLLACNEGSRCGGNQYAYDRLTLPDTGISAGAILVLVFLQRDPYLIPERTDIAIQHAFESPNTGGPAPFVRLVRTDGSIVFEGASSRSSQAEPWKLLYTSHDADFRRTLFAALQAQDISLQLVPTVGQLPGTIVPILADEQGVQPIMTCL